MIQPHSILPAIESALAGRKRAGFRAKHSREAGVLMPLFERHGEPHMLLTRRSQNVATHKGQISFPGGRREEHDDSLIVTALRETEEEIGLPRSAVRLLGELDAVFTAVSNYTVYPVAGIIAHPGAFTHNDGEIDLIIEVPLAALLDPAHFRAEHWQSASHRGEIYFFEVGEHVIWGLTAHIIKTMFDQVFTGWNNP